MTMQKFVVFVLENLVESRSDIFGENASFLAFKCDNDEDFDWSNGYNSTAVFGRISYSRDKQTHFSGPLAVKVSPQMVNFKEFCVLAFFNEIFFYTRIVPLFQSVRPVHHLFPKYYDSLMQFGLPVDHQVIVFENLQAAGYLCSKRKSYLDYHHLALMMRKLGEFHAYSYRLKKEASDLFGSLVNSLSETNYIVLKCMPNILMKLAVRGLLPLLSDSKYRSKVAAFRNRINEADQIMADILSGDKNNPLAVLCHGDFLASNVLFKYDQEKPYELKLIDLGSCRIASPVVDLVPMLYLNADQGLRNAHWDDLINEYYTALQGTFEDNEVPSKDEIVNEFKEKAILGYFIASYFLPRLISEDMKLPDFVDLIPQEYNTALYGSIPQEILVDVFTRIGGDVSTRALTDILRDMVDRGFL